MPISQNQNVIKSIYDNLIIVAENLQNYVNYMQYLSIPSNINSNVFTDSFKNLPQEDKNKFYTFFKQMSSISKNHPTFYKNMANELNNKKFDIDYNMLFNSTKFYETCRANYNTYKSYEDNGIIPKNSLCYYMTNCEKALKSIKDLLINNKSSFTEQRITSEI